MSERDAAGRAPAARPSSGFDRTAPIEAGWARRLLRRGLVYWPVKMFGTTLGIAGFFVLYFWVMRHGAAHALVMPLVFADRWFALHDDALWLYASLWLYVSLPSAFAANGARLFRYAWKAALTAGIGLTLFWLFPTAVPAFDVPWQAYPKLAFLKTSDAGGNACPSLHVAFAALACGTFARQLRDVGAPRWARALNVLWAAGIIYSTLATRQHVALDVLGGLVLGLAVDALSWRPTRHRK